MRGVVSLGLRLFPVAARTLVLVQKQLWSLVALLRLICAPKCEVIHGQVLSHPPGTIYQVAQEAERSLNMAQETNQYDEATATPASQDEPAPSQLYKRPGCVTAYAVILGIGAVLVGLLGIISIFASVSDADLSIGPAIIFLAAAVVDFLIARGVWRLKNWARIAVIVVQSLGILFSLLGLFAQALPVFGTVIGLGVSGYIVYWFASHSEYFD
jgi:hypothetical protein